MPRSRPCLALLLALAALLASACGGSEEQDRKLIAQSRAEAMLKTIDRVQDDIEAARCGTAGNAVERLRGQVADLPASYDTKLVGNLNEWVDHLEAEVPAACEDADATPTPDETETPDPTPEPEATATPEPEETATPEPEETTTPEPEETISPSEGEGESPPDNGGVSPDDLEIP